jgi:hypothetical protein
MATFFAWLTGRGFQLLSGPVGYALLAGVGLIVGGLAYEAWKASITDAAVTKRDLVWSTKVNDATTAARKADQDRQDAITKAADAQRVAESAKQNLDVARGEVTTLEQKIATLTAAGQRTLCVPKDFPRSK